jgi:hypothetical protein
MRRPAWLTDLRLNLVTPDHLDGPGNHDFDRGNITHISAAVQALCARSPRPHWVPGFAAVALTRETALVGHDGWADGRFSDYEWSEILRNDHLMIEESAGLDEGDRRLNARGDEAAAHFRSVLPGAPARFRRSIVLTHVLPFREACWHGVPIWDGGRLPTSHVGPLGKR